MVKRSKRYQKALEAAPKTALSLADAVKALQALPKAGFDETVEMYFRLNVDPKQSTQMVRGTVRLPNGSGKTVRVIVFTENPEEALKAGADKAGFEDLIKEVTDGFLDFDVAISTTSAMKEVRKVARVLGPKGLMPNPKYGAPRSNPDGGISLHARRITFVHPVRKEQMTVEAPVPSSWKGI